MTAPQITMADMERQLGQMVVQLVAAQKVIEAQAAELAALKAKESSDGQHSVSDAVGTTPHPV